MNQCRIGLNVERLNIEDHDDTVSVNIARDATRQAEGLPLVKT